MQVIEFVSHCVMKVNVNCWCKRCSWLSFFPYNIKGRNNTAKNIQYSVLPMLPFKKTPHLKVKLGKMV